MITDFKATPVEQGKTEGTNENIARQQELNKQK